MTNSEVIKDCRKLAKSQSIVFKRSKAINKINGMACYEIESGIQYKVLHQGSLDTIYQTLLSESCANQ